MTLDTGPDAASLLANALEKLLYLESRLEAAEAAREDATRESDRQRTAAREARRALAEWQRRATESEVAAEGAEREAGKLREALLETRSALAASPGDKELAQRLGDAEERLARYRREREVWLDRMVALGRLRTNQDDDELDLGSFIAELRAELVALRRGDADPPRTTLGDRPPKPDARAIVASVPEPRVDPEELVRTARLSRPERTLALLCARDLASDAAIVRQRAAERLTEAGIGALVPYIVSLLHTEPDARVRAACVALVDKTGGDSALLVLEETVQDADPLVRTAALEGLARRGVLDRIPVLADPSAAVRRRALTLLARDGRTLDLITDALRDDDASVRRVAAHALARRTGKEAVALLSAATRAADPDVARIAADALRVRGIEPVEVPPVEEPVAEVVVVPVEPEPPVEAAPEPTPEPVPEPPIATADPESDPIGALADVVLEELRMTLRGRSREELSDLLQLEPDLVDLAVERLLGDARAVWRGPKLYPS